MGPEDECTVGDDDDDWRRRRRISVLIDGIVAFWALGIIKNAFTVPCFN